MKLLQSVGAVIAGVVAVVGLSLGTDVVVEHAGLVPPADRVEDYTQVQWGIVAGYRTLFNVVGGYLTARLSPYRPQAHAIVLGCIGFAAALAGVFVAMNFMPPDSRWYPIALVVTAIPFCWLGGFLGRRKAVTT